MADEASLDVMFVIGVAAVFLAGLLALFAYSWVRESINNKPNSTRGDGGSGNETAESERLEYLEGRLVDMKIRLDALEMMQGQLGGTVGRQEVGGGGGREAVGRQEVGGGGGREAAPDPAIESLERLLTKVLEEREGGEERGKVGKKGDQKPPSKNHDASGIKFPTYPNPTDYVLQLITNGVTTSRDIQITMGRSREHTARLLKKMYRDGYLQRSEGARPYSYSITPKGMKRLENA